MKFGFNPNLIRSGITLSLVSVVALLAGCGSGSGSTPTQPSQTYNISLSEISLKISAGSSESVSVSVTTTNGYNRDVTIIPSGVPSNVTISPSTAVLVPGQSQQFTFSAPSYISTSTSIVTFSTVGTDPVQTASLSLEMLPYSGNVSLNRTGYLGLNAVQPYTVFFDSNTNRFFVSDPGSNQIMVVDATTRKEVGAITVPGAYGLDETPDHKTLWVGTEIGDVYAVNPVSMIVTHRYMYSQIGPNGFQANTALVLANGKVALLNNPGGGGISPIDGTGAFAVWNPATNTLTVYGGLQSCEHIFEMALTGDRNSIVVTSGNRVCTLNSTTGQVNQSNIVGFPATPTPDGKSILLLQYGDNAEILVLNAQTLAQTASFPVVGTSGSFMVVSPDSSTVYIAPQTGGGIAYAYNIANGNKVGWIPTVSTYGAVSATGDWISAVDNTGLLAGVTVEGIAFLDAAAMRTGTVGKGYLGGYVQPVTGPMAGGTPVNVYFQPSSDLVAAYFGPTQSQSITPDSGLLDATTPPGSAGPVDVDLMFGDGGEEFIPTGFSYGPQIAEATTNFSTADGGGTGTIFGYGFGPNTGSKLVIPSGLAVNIGGQQATITGFNYNPYDDSNPIPIESVSFTIPPKTAGTASDITVMSDSGTTTLNKGLNYLPAVQQVGMSGTASLAQGIYDPIRDQYYFTDAAEIRVYSRTQNQWLTSLQVPQVPNGTTHRLWGMGLSPDGSKLAVADPNAGMIYVLNPDAPGTVQSYTFNVAYFAGSPAPPGLGQSRPTAVAISDMGMIYLVAPGCDGCDGFFKLDTTSGKVTDYKVPADGDKVAITSDNSTVFYNNDGEVFSVNTATDKLSSALDGPGCCYGDDDLTLSASQSTLEATSYLYDTNINAESYLALDDPHSVSTTYVDGTQLNGDGTLLFQPSTNGIDVFDARVGILLDRIALPVTLSQNYDALVSDGKDNVLIAITGQTGSGIAIIDLSSLTELTPLPYKMRNLSWETATALPANTHRTLNRSLPTPSVRASRVSAASIPRAVNMIQAARLQHRASSVMR